jgi:Uma2 family endonuclease
MALPSPQPISFETYLELEERATVKHELVGGFLYAMAGAAEKHNLIATNVVLALGTAARAKGCRLYVADMKLRTPVNSAYYPDVMVVCDATDQHNLYRVAPCLLVEILSKSTSVIDQREKLLEYRRIPSLENYLIVDPDAQRVIRHFRDGDAWTSQVYGAEQSMFLECPGVELSVSDVFIGL